MLVMVSDRDVYILGDEIVGGQTRSLKGDSWGWWRLDKINKGNSIG